MNHLHNITKRILFFFASAFLKLKKPNQCISDLSIWSLEADEKGHLLIGGCDHEQLIKEYGTPLHVVNQSRLMQDFKDFCNSFKAYTNSVEVYYSYKTNSIPGILRFLHQQGAGAEVISEHELWLAIQLGVPPEKIIYNGTFKTNESLKLAVNKQIKLINIDSFKEIHEIAALAKDARKVPQVGLRVCVEVGWESQFGFKIKTGEAVQAYKTCAAYEHLEVCGIHVHLGTCIKNPSMYTAAITNVLAFIKDTRDQLGIENKDPRGKPSRFARLSLRESGVLKDH